MGLDKRNTLTYQLSKISCRDGTTSLLVGVLFKFAYTTKVPSTPLLSEQGLRAKNHVYCTVPRAHLHKGKEGEQNWGVRLSCLVVMDNRGVSSAAVRAAPFLLSLHNSTMHHCGSMDRIYSSQLTKQRLHLDNWYHKWNCYQSLHHGCLECPFGPSCRLS